MRTKSKLKHFLPIHPLLPSPLQAEQRNMEWGLWSVDNALSLMLLHRRSLPCCTMGISSLCLEHLLTSFCSDLGDCRAASFSFLLPRSFTAFFTWLPPLLGWLSRGWFLITHVAGEIRHLDAPLQPSSRDEYMP